MPEDGRGFARGSGWLPVPETEVCMAFPWRTAGMGQKQGKIKKSRSENRDEPVKKLMRQQKFYGNLPKTEGAPAFTFRPRQGGKPAACSGRGKFPVKKSHYGKPRRDFWEG